MSWQVGTVVALADETATARTLTLAVPDWPGHLAGQHVDVRLTAEDGYQAARAYSIASAATGPGPAHVEITVDAVADGEVSPYLAEKVVVGQQLELRGPLGGWFVWRPSPGPVQLIAGGSGVVPLMSMLRTQTGAPGSGPMRLLYSARTPHAVLYKGEDFPVDHVWTRQSPDGGPVGRIGAPQLAAYAYPPEDGPAVYVCGPTPFVETVAGLLVSWGHDPARVRTERFG